MERRTLERNPLPRRIIGVAVVGAIGTMVGILLIVAVQALVAGIAVIASVGILEGVLIVAAIARLDCPECGRRLERIRMGRLYRCTSCDIEWEIPETAS